MASRYFRVALGEIAYVRAIVEGYDGMAVVKAAGANRGEIEWAVGEGMEAEAEALVQKLEREGIGMIEIARPADWEA